MSRRTEIHALLHWLGATENYRGFHYMACVVELCLEQPDRLLMVTKWLYPEVARRYDTNWRAVERDLRTVSGVIWREQRSRLEEIAGGHLEKRPYPAQLLAILVSRLEGSRW